MIATCPHCSGVARVWHRARARQEPGGAFGSRTDFGQNLTESPPKTKKLVPVLGQILAKVTSGSHRRRIPVSDELFAPISVLLSVERINAASGNRTTRQLAKESRGSGWAHGRPTPLE